MYLLDSSVAIELLTAGKRSEAALSFLGHADVALTSFTVHEILVGLKTGTEPWVAFAGMLPVLTYDRRCAEISARIDKELTKKGHKVGLIDILIASVAIHNGLPLVTFDKSFSRIRDLDVKIL